MNDVPHNDDSPDDIDDIYRRASAQDSSRPSPRVHQSVLQHATQLAAERTLMRPRPPHTVKKFFPSRRETILGTLAAAVLAGLVIAPQFLLAPPRPITFKPPVAIARIQAALPTPATTSAPPPQFAVNDSASLERAKAPKLAEAPARAAASAPSSAPAAAAPAPPSPSAGATTMVNGLSAEAVVGGYLPRDETYIVTEAPTSPLVGAAVRRAAEQGDMARLQFLLDRGADINARDADNRSPLMLAVTHSRAKVVEVLLAHGADANTADRSGTTPLQAAISTHQMAVAAMLRAAGAH